MKSGQYWGGQDQQLKSGKMQKDPSRALQQHPLLSKGASPVPGGARTGIQHMVPQGLLLFCQGAARIGLAPQ